METFITVQAQVRTCSSFCILLMSFLIGYTTIKETLFASLAGGTSKEAYERVFKDPVAFPAPDSFFMMHSCFHR